jgi:hypothetical protein
MALESNFNKTQQCIVYDKKCSLKWILEFLEFLRRWFCLCYVWLFECNSWQLAQFQSLWTKLLHGFVLKNLTITINRGLFEAEGHKWARSLDVARYGIRHQQIVYSLHHIRFIVYRSALWPGTVHRAWKTKQTENYKASGFCVEWLAFMAGSSRVCI